MAKAAITVAISTHSLSYGKGVAMAQAAITVAMSTYILFLFLFLSVPITPLTPHTHTHHKVPNPDTGSKCLEDGAKFYCTALVVGPDGTLVKTYHKRATLGNAQTPGTRPCTFDTPFGKVGARDLRTDPWITFTLRTLNRIHTKHLEAWPLFALH